MRKLIILVLFLCVLGVGAAALWFTLLKKPVAFDLTTHLPDSVQLFIEIPDGVTAALGYQGSDLKKVYASDEVTALMAYSMATLGSSADDATQQKIDALTKNWEEMTDEYTSQLSGRSFLAASVTKLENGEPTQLPYQVLIGIKPRSALADPAELLTWFKEDLASHLPDNAKISQTTYNELPCTSITIPVEDGTPFDIEMKMLVHDGWFLASLGEDLLHPFLDNLAAPGTHPSLAAATDYQELIAKYTGPEPMTHMYLKTDTLIENFLSQIDHLETMADDHQKDDPQLQESLDQIQKQMEQQQQLIAAALEGLGSTYAALWFDGARLHSQSWTKWDETPARDRTLGPTTGIAYTSFEMTSPDTMVYVTTPLDIKAQIEHIDQTLQDTMNNAGAASGSKKPVEPVDWRKTASEALQPMGLDLDKNIINPMGNEISYSINWKDGNPYPSLSLFIEIDNATDFQITYDTIKKSTLSISEDTEMFQARSEAAGNMDVLYISSPNIPEVKPGIFYSGTLMGITSDSSQLVNDAEPSTMFHALDTDPLAVSMKEGSFSFYHIRLAELTRRGYPELFKLAKTHVPDLEDEKLTKMLEVMPEELSFTDALGSMTSASYAHGNLIETRSVMNGDIFFPFFSSMLAAIAATGDDLTNVFAAATAPDDSDPITPIEAPAGPLNDSEQKFIGLWSGQCDGFQWEMDRKDDRTFEIAMHETYPDGGTYQNTGHGVWWIDEEEQLYHFQWHRELGFDGGAGNLVIQSISSVEAEEIVTLSEGEANPENVEVRIEERSMTEWELEKAIYLPGPGK